MTYKKIIGVLEFFYPYPSHSPAFELHIDVDRGEVQPSVEEAFRGLVHRYGDSCLVGDPFAVVATSNGTRRRRGIYGPKNLQM